MFAPPKRHRLVAAILRRFVLSCVLVGFLASSVGYVAVKRGEADALSAATTAKPFPCQDHHCGCTAESCWNDCCCFSREERLAWGVKHGLRVSAEALGIEQPRERACCAKSKKFVRDIPTCTSPKPVATTKVKTPPTKIEVVYGFAAKRCRGQGVDWFAGVVALPTTPMLLISPTTPLVGVLHAPAAVVPFGSLEPPAPPPRIVPFA